MPRELSQPEQIPAQQIPAQQIPAQQIPAQLINQAQLRNCRGTPPPSSPPSAGD